MLDATQDLAFTIKEKKQKNINIASPWRGLKNRQGTPKQKKEKNKNHTVNTYEDFLIKRGGLNTTGNKQVEKAIST